MASNMDRRRINGPSGGTTPPVFSSTIKDGRYLEKLRPRRTRGPNEPRKLFLQTSIVPSASGSAYLEIPSTSSSSSSASLIPSTSSLKIVASIQGPRPLPRTQPYSATLLLTTTVKFAPFATRYRRGYIRDAVERDLGVHLETALRGVVIGERWPKSGVEVVVTILEGDEDRWWGDQNFPGTGAGGGWGVLNVLAGCITVASAAIVDAGIDCVDVVAGGVAAMIRIPDAKKVDEETVVLLDPCPAEHQDIAAACVVGYLASRDEITEMWLKGDVGTDTDNLIESATHAAIGSLSVMKSVLLETIEARAQTQDSVKASSGKRKQQDVEMSG